MNKQDKILDIQNMSIGEWDDMPVQSTENRCRMKVIRVPGGWIYHFTKHYNSECAVFVPYRSI